MRSSSAPRRYADGTQVPVERTRTELEKLLTAHGATAFGVFKEPERTVVMYRLRERYIKHVMRVAEPPKGEWEALGGNPCKLHAVDPVARAGARGDGMKPSGWHDVLCKQLLPFFCQWLRENVV